MPTSTTLPSFSMDGYYKSEEESAMDKWDIFETDRCSPLLYSHVKAIPCLVSSASAKEGISSQTSNWGYKGTEIVIY